jgi:predicted nucleic acid-binding OB-fold protein
MKKKKSIRNKWLTVRLNDDEEKKLKQFCSRTTSKAISEYARDILLKEPVIIVYRNASADDFLEEMILLKNELNAIGKNFNQAVHKLHMLDHVHEIKSWALLNETSKKIYFQKIEEINEKLNQIHHLWLQK